MQILMLNATEVEQLLDLDALLQALAQGFLALSHGLVDAPSRSAVAVPERGVVLTMPAYQHGREITVKLVSVFHGNEQLGLPSHHALVCLLESQTGMPISIMDGAYLTAMRTAGAAALSTRLLARSDADKLAIIGAGVQGASHLRMLPRVRPFSEIRIASHHLAHAERLAEYNSRARAVETVEQAVRGADVVCLCTNAEKPVISLDWLKRGTHITSVGYRPPGSELDRKVIEQGRLFVETRLAFSPPPAGCAELMGVDPSVGTELGEVLEGVRQGRVSNDELTVYKAMGHGVEDMAAASLVYHRAKQEGIGRLVVL